MKHAFIAMALIGLTACGQTPGKQAEAEMPPAQVNAPTPVQAVLAPTVPVAAYVPYTPQRLADAFKSGKPFALFFHAAWCPTCRKLDQDIRKNQAQLGDAVILKTDYDTETALKRQYGIRVQHTVVFFDAAGKPVQTKIGASGKDLITYFGS